MSDKQKDKPKDKFNPILDLTKSLDGVVPDSFIKGMLSKVKELKKQ